MAVKVRDLGKSADRFQRRAANAVQEYVEGAQENTSWESNASAAQGNYDAGVQAAVNKKSFGKGVRRAGQAKFVKGVVEKGATRYPAGVGAAGPDWQKGFQPHADAIAGLNLPARAPRGSDVNYERAKMVGKALAAKRAQLKG